MSDLSSTEPHRADWLVDGLLADTHTPQVDTRAMQAVLDKLDESAPNVLLRHLRAARKLPSGIARSLAPAGLETSWRDRPLCQQAVWEATLHVLAAVSIAMQREDRIPAAASSDLASYAHWPSIG